MSESTVHTAQPPPPRGGSPDASHNRRKHPCVLCQQRKVKCDRNEPCNNCTRARVECISPSTLPPKRRKKRFPEAELLARLRKYEDHLRGYGADIDAINGGGIVPLPIPVKESGSPGLAVEQPTRAPPQLAIRQPFKHHKNNLWSGVNDEFKDAEDILQGSSEDEMYETPITKTYDAIHSDGSDLFFSSPPTENLIDLHPSPVHIFRLWQLFLDNVNPVIKPFHAPTIQQQVLEASAKLDDLPKGVEALMFGIYSTAIISLSETDCVSIFGEEKLVLRTRYQGAARQALQKAGVLRTTDITILQAFLLYLISCLNFQIDPRSLFCLTGIAVRIAQRMGLSSDGTEYNLPPFEVELRRRLWWQILMLDFRVSELSGAGANILTHVWSTKFPLNVNDSDLYSEMKDPPAEHPGRVTEMVFVLNRCEITSLFQDIRGSTDSVATKDKAIDALSARLETTYLQYCDPNIPLHSLALLTTRSGIAKLHMGPRHPNILSVKAIQTPESDNLFKLSLQLIENHNMLMGSNANKHFFWHIVTNFPFPAHIYLLCSLRYRAGDEWADKAWALFMDFFRIRGIWWDKADKDEVHKRQDSVMHLAMANLTIKAWDARVVAKPGITTPDTILELKEKIAKKKSPKGEAMDTPAQPLDGGVYGTAFSTDPFSDTFSWMDQPQNEYAQGNEAFMMPGLMGTETPGMGMDWGFWNGVSPQGGGGGMPGIYNS